MSDLRGLDLYGNKLASMNFYYSTSRDKNLALPLPRPAVLQGGVENRKMFGPETEKQFILRKGFIASFDSFLSYINTAIEESKKHYNEHKWNERGIYYILSNDKKHLVKNVDLIRHKSGIYMFTNKITKKVILVNQRT